MKSEKSLKKRFMPLFIVLLVLVLVVAVATPTIAYYIRSAGKVGGEHTPAEASNPSFKLDNEDKPMENVYITVKDEGYPVYVRVSIVITWQKLADCTGTDCEDCTVTCTDCEDCPRCNNDPDDDWDVIFAIPQKGVDYSLTLGDKWTTVENNEFYYCTSAVQSRFPDYDKLEPLSTPVFITECKLLSTAQPPIEGCVLNVELIVQTIQAIGYTDPDKNGNETPAWQDAWGLTKNPFN